MAAGTSVGDVLGRGLSGHTPEASALWLLVAIEVLTLVGLRRYFRRHHGG